MAKYYQSVVHLNDLAIVFIPCLLWPQQAIHELNADKILSKLGNAIGRNEPDHLKKNSELIVQSTHGKQLTGAVKVLLA